MDSEADAPPELPNLASLGGQLAPPAIVKGWQTLQKLPEITRQAIECSVPPITFDEPER